MPAADQAVNANLEECAGLEPVQHKGPPEISKAKGLNAFMTAKLANAIGKGTTLGFTPWQSICGSANLLALVLHHCLASFLPACSYMHAELQVGLSASLACRCSLCLYHVLIVWWQLHCWVSPCSAVA